jgi:hypothetical protein
MRQQSGYRTCEICGKEMKARGIGSHLRQVHGIVITNVIHDSTKVSNNSTVVIHDSTKVSNNSTIVANHRTIVKRPGDYLRKRSEVIETKIEPAIPDWLPGTGWFKNPFPNGPYWIQKGPDSLGRHWCKNCGGWYVIGEIPGGYNCVPGKQHEFDI